MHRLSRRCIWREKLISLAIGLVMFWTGARMLAQSPSEMPVEPSRVLQLPLSGRSSQSSSVTVMQGTTNSGGGNSVITVDSSVAVPAPYSGSVATGAATQEVLPLTLEAALAMGLRANLGALSQSAATEQAQGQRLIARSELLPQVNTVISEVFEKENLRTLGVSLPIIPTTSKFNYYDARAVRLQQSLFDLVRIRNLQGASENIRANIKAARNTRDLIVLAVAGSYLQLLATGARVEAANAQVTTFRAIYKQAADRRTAGLATRVDADRSLVQLQTQQQRLRSLQADQETQSLRLARIIGLPLGQRFVANEQYLFSPVTLVAEGEALKRAESDRSDLQAAASGVKSAGLAVKAAHAERIPSLGVNADFGAAGVTPTNHSTSVYTVSGTLTVPLYEGGRIHGDIVQAQAVLRQRKAEFEDLRGQVDEDIRQAFIDLNSAADQVGVAQSNSTLARETLQQSRDRFTSGVADTVELVQAEQSVVQADDDAITAVFEHNLAKVALSRAMGSAEQTLPQLLRKR